MRISKFAGNKPKRVRKGYFICGRDQKQYCRSLNKNAQGKYLIYKRRRSGQCSGQNKSFKGPMVRRCYQKGFVKYAGVSRQRPKRWESNASFKMKYSRTPTKVPRSWFYKMHRKVNGKWVLAYKVPNAPRMYPKRKKAFNLDAFLLDRAADFE